MLVWVNAMSKCCSEKQSQNGQSPDRASVCALPFNCDDMTSDLAMVSGYQDLEHSSWV